jgi:FKBP-type peptidyl-prolyl cis-trans isomerase FkpA
VKQYVAAAVFFALIMTACADGGTPAAGSATRESATEQASPAFASELGIDLDAMTTTPGGVRYLDVQVGRGAEVQPGRHVTVEYRAWLPDGTLFEERPNAAGWGPSEFLLGASAPVPGLNEGMTGMRAGGTRRIVIPSELGYGLVGRPAGVPDESTLVFEVRVTAVRD